MRKIVCSLFAGIVSFALTAGAYAGQSYSGSGTWKSSLGQSGLYTATATVSSLDKKIRIDEAIIVDGKSYPFTFILDTHGSDGFYFVYNTQNEFIGSGYCVFPSEPGIPTKFCHSDIVVSGGNVESTVKITEAVIYRMGSKINPSTGERFVWSDKLEASGVKK